MSAEPVGVADIAVRAGVAAVTVRQWRRRHRDFPAPRWTVSGQPAWDWADVESWLGRRVPAPRYEDGGSIDLDVEAVYLADGTRLAEQRAGEVRARASSGRRSSGR